MRFTVQCFIVAGCLLLLLASPPASAQQYGSVRGSVKDTSGNAIPSASIELFTSVDSIRQRSLKSDLKGNFKFENIISGDYYASVQAFGFNPAFFKIMVIQGETQLTPFVLQHAVVKLEDVKIIAERSLVEYKTDRLLINIAGNTNLTGANGVEIFEKLPGVSLDSDGNVLLNGKPGVAIMMDGRLVSLTGAQLYSFIQSQSYFQIARIEIISNPSAQFDAAGNAGIINIITRRAPKNNSFLNLSSGLTRGELTRAGFNIAGGMSTKKLSMQASLNANANEDFARPAVNRFYQTGIERLFKQYSDQSVSTRNWSGSWTIDYTIAKQTSIGMSASFSSGNNNTSTIGTASFYDINEEILLYSAFNGLSGNRPRNSEVNLNLRHTFDSLGRKLSIEAGYFQFKQTSAQSSVTETYRPNATAPVDKFNLTGNLPAKYQVSTVKADYTHPVSAKLKFDAGIKMSRVNNNALADYYFGSNGVQTPDTGRSNHFIYSEHIYAAYINSVVQVKKMSLQLGVRAEQTNLSGNQLALQQKFTSRYTELFPTIFLAYKITDRASLSLNAGRRIDRPDFQDLNPFQFFLDLYTYRQGNPQLRPHFAKNVELNFAVSNGIALSAFYSHIKNNISRVFVSANDSTKAAYQTTINLNHRTNYGLSAHYPVKFTSWWSSSYNLQVFVNKYAGNIKDAMFDQSAFSYAANISQGFKHSASFNSELSFVYRSGFLYGTFRNKAMHNLSAGMSKSFNKNKFTLRLNVNDILYSWKRRFDVDYSNMKMTYRRPNDTRYVRLTFIYLFNKPFANKVRSVADDEKSRAGGGE